MNKKIKDLAIQAGFIPWADEAWAPGDDFDWSSIYDNELEEFAKLIQTQCARIAISYMHSNSFESHDDLSNYERGCDDTAALISSRINNMFRAN